MFLLLFTLFSIKAHAGCLNYYDTDEVEKQVNGFYDNGAHIHNGPFICSTSDCTCMDGIDPEAAQIIIVNGKRIVQQDATKSSAKAAAKAARVAQKITDKTTIDGIAAKIKDGSVKNSELLQYIKLKDGL